MPCTNTEMIQSRRFASLIGCLAVAAGLLPIAAAPSRAGGVEPLVVAPAAPVQGDTVAFIVHAAPGSSVAARFNGTPLSVFRVSEGVWRALRGTDPDTPPGTYPVAVTITPPGGSSATIRQTVRIGTTQFAERHLTLPTGTVSLITPKNISIEWSALNTVLGRRT